MVNIRNVGTPNSRSSGAAALLKVTMAGALFFSALPVFADTSSDSLKAMEGKINALQEQISQMASGAASRSGSDEGLPLHGFMDVGFALNTDKSVDANNWPIRPKGFNVGGLSFYLTPHFGNKIKALVEPNFEVTKDGAVSTDLERLQIGYTFSDTMTLWGGRFHTPYGFWNTGFHHGAQIQTSVLRPRFLDFEDKGGILPAHMVGLWGTGKIKAGTGKFTYDVFAGNGPKITGTIPPPPALQTPGPNGVLDINLAGDNNHQAMVGLNLGYEFSGNLGGLRLAVHSMRGDVDDDVLPNPNKTELSMAGGSLVYLENDWEALAEFYKFNNNDKSGTTGSHSSSANYLQIGRTFTDLTPYFRKEFASLDQQDNYFSKQANGQSYSREVIGIKYDLDPRANLKLEIHYSNFADEPGRTSAQYHSLYTQYAIRF